MRRCWLVGWIAVAAYRALAQRDRSRAGEAADGLERVARAALAANDRAAVVSALAALRAVAPERPLGRYARLAALDATDRGDSAAALAILPSAVATAGDPRAADSLLYLYGMAAARARDCTTAVAAFEGEDQGAAAFPDSRVEGAVPQRGRDEAGIEHRAKPRSDVHFPIANLTCGCGLR